MLVWIHRPASRPASGVRADQDGTEERYCKRSGAATGTIAAAKRASPRNNSNPPKSADNSREVDRT